MRFMKGDDLNFASKLSLAQRNIESARLTLDSAEELMRDLVGGFEKMQRILMAEEFRRQEHLTAQTRADGMMTPQQFAEEFLNFATGKRTAPPAMPDVFAEASQEQKPKRNMTTAQLEQLARARAARQQEQNPKQIEDGSGNGAANGKLKPIKKGFSHEWGMYPYPYLIKSYIEKNPSGTFTAEDVITHAAEMGYAAELQAVRQSLSHQMAMGALKNTSMNSGGSGSGQPGIYVRGDKTILGVPLGRVAHGSVDAPKKRLGRPPLPENQLKRKRSRSLMGGAR